MPNPIKDIFNEATDVSGDARTRLLEARCGTDAQLRSAVESLLHAHDSAGDFFAEPTNAHARIPDPNPPPKQIGAYKILQTIGEGGFGTVYLAEQQHPVRRRVALKLIKLGMDTKQVIARFEAERQALAMMDHPNIARVFDGGATDNGRPYFVMELVNGVPITQYCDDTRLTARQRLELFIPVCQAVQHAHQKGVIHRDLKPSNVMITLHDGRPVPKVIDFGVAKATQSRLTEKTLFTEFRSMIGTPEYMSPEQAEMSGLDVDTRSDVYSLGVLLYELLTGSTPFDARELRSKAYGEMQRVIREVDPPKPSTRISTSQTLATVAAQRSTEPRKLRSTVRGEIDRIVMHCIEKDRSRRYESAAALADDVGRYLADEPVRAVAPSNLYRARKYIRRHRVGVAASVAIVLALVGGVIGTTIGFIRASRQRAEARQSAAIAEAVSRFQSDMLASADPQRLLGDKVTVVEAISGATRELDAGALRDQPLVEIHVRQMIGSTLQSLGRFDDAELNFRRALELHRAYGPDDEGTARSLTSLGAVHVSRGDYATADRLLRESLALQRSVHAPPGEVVTTLTNLSVSLRSQGKPAEAETLLREVIQINAREKTDELAVAAGQTNLAQALLEQGKVDEAEPLFRAALTSRRRSLPAGHPELLSTLSNLAMSLMQKKQYDEAITFAREAADTARKTYPSNHPDLASAVTNLGTIYLTASRFPEAEPLLREALEMQRKTLPPNHLDLAFSLNNLASTLRRQGKYPEAIAAYREAIHIARASLPPDHPNMISCVKSLAGSLKEHADFADAEPVYRELLAAQIKAFGANDWHVATTKLDLAEVLMALKRPQEAAPLVREAQPIIAAEPKAADWRVTADELTRQIDGQTRPATAESAPSSQPK